LLNDPTLTIMMTSIRSTTLSARWRLIYAVTALAMAAATLTGCSSHDSHGGAAHDSHGAASDTLLVGSDLTYPPYAYFQGKTPSGFDPEIMEKLGQQMGMKVRFVDTRFEQLIPSLNAGKFDVIASALYITAERAKKVDYVPYFSTGSSILVRKGTAAVKNVTDMCGLRVAVIQGGVPAGQLPEESKKCTANDKGAIDIRPFPTDPEGTQALMSGQVDAQVSDAAVAAKVSEKTNGAVQVSSTELLHPIPVGLGVKKGNNELKTKIEDGLAALKKSGAYQDLLSEYNLEPPDEAQVSKILGK
jgi:polar amino acid transport system permease protein/polar amino acid transport system substrate-binding protein